MSVILCKQLKVSPAMPAAPKSSPCAQTSWDTEPTPSLAAKHTHWQQWCQEAAPTCFPLLTWVCLCTCGKEEGGYACIINSEHALPGGHPHTVMENLTSGWQSWWSSKEGALVSAAIRLSSAFLPNVCPHSSPLWRGCQSSSLQHIPTTACSHRFLEQGKAKQILHSPIVPLVYLADSRYVPHIWSTANQADVLSQEIHVFLSNV